MNDENCTFGLWYDFRNPERWPRTFTDFYAQTLEQITWPRPGASNRSG